MEASVNENEGKVGNLKNMSGGESVESSSNSIFLASEITLNDENSSSEEISSLSSTGWPMGNDDKVPHCNISEVSEEVDNESYLDKRKLEKLRSCLSDSEMMKERFSKLLLGEDMSGCGNGVCTALAISNAITNLCATVFGQVWRLEPLRPEKKLMWRREIEWLICVSDHIVELIPSWQTFPDGSKLEVMTSRPRSDLYINLPALRKLDNMLLEILDSFKCSEFWYVDQGIVAPETELSSSALKPLARQEDKWWLPVPRVPPGGLSEDARKMLQHRRDCTNQILKASMAINSAVLAEMDIPDSYLEALPKIANRVEAAIYVWRRKMTSKPVNGTHRSNSKSSWDIVKDFVSDADKREQLADRAESLLLCLKQRFPGLTQTDVGKSILESYSRVLESLAFNIVARVDDLLYVDDLSKHSDQLVSISKVGVLNQKSTGIPLPFPSSPYKTAFSTPSYSPLLLISPANGNRLPYIESSKHSLHGFGLKRIFTDYLSVDGKGKDPFSPSLESVGSKEDMSARANESVEDE
ncbi:hypothetical protein DH2020_040225 [Rehmannia glutinosa]|uniref:PRONE domain-containing protein n=1 Tax=Rehmannia glutinosa TaxID=99300 RepID=A0ABR0UUD5_REHGL